MKQHILGFSVVRRLRQSPVFAFLLAVLLCGMLAGCVTGMHIPQGNETYVSELAQLLASNAVGKMPSVRTVAACLAGAYGWMLAAVILAAIPGRLLWIALLMALCMVTGLVVLVFNMIAKILNEFIDPRMQYEKRLGEEAEYESEYEA